jgi:hypothetical protein
LDDETSRFDQEASTKLLMLSDINVRENGLRLWSSVNRATKGTRALGREQEPKAEGLPLASRENESTATSTDPKGGAQGCAPFSVSPWMANRKIPAAMTLPVSFVGESPFFWLLFFGLRKEK